MSSQEHSGDEQPDEQEGADAVGGEQPAQDAAPAPAEEKMDRPQDERIAEVAEHIDKARTQAEEAGVLVEEDEETFVDSGITDTQDDQTIAPPG